MGHSDAINPSEQRGGTTPGGEEAGRKGEWAATAQEGVVPAELGGSDAPPELLDEDPELGRDALGTTTGSETPATASGIDLSAGDQADAVRDGGAVPPNAGMPDVKDAPAGPREVDR